MTREKEDLLILNAAQIITCRGPIPKTGRALRGLGVIENGAVACSRGRIVWVGKTKNIPRKISNFKIYIDARDKIVMPGFVDPHTHLVFGGSREDEFAEKLQGVPYLEILRRGGGILNTVERTRSASDLDLYRRAINWLDAMMSVGTTTVEIKSGYGLNLKDELRMLKVVNDISWVHKMDVVSTFLGAHTWPKEKSHEEYMAELAEMIEIVSRRPSAEFCDVFCEENAFSLEESRRILEHAKSRGMKLKIHAGEFNDLCGAKLAAELGATSLDHGENISAEDMLLLAKMRIPVVLMPGVNFHLGSRPADARTLIKAGVPVALATDFNPGSSPVFSMQFIMQLACRMYGMTPEEAISASTINAAYAIDRADSIGSIERDKQADLLVLNIPNYRQLPYWVATNCVETVIKNGEVVYKYIRV